MTLTLLLIAGFVLTLLVWTVVLNWKDRQRRLPPGPIRLPIVGNLLALGETMNIMRSAIGLAREPSFLAEVLGNFEPRYGPLVRIQLGGALAVVINDPELLHEALVKRAKKYSDRPQTPTIRRVYNLDTGEGAMRGFVFNQGAPAKELRTLVMQKLLKKSLIDTMAVIIHDEAMNAVRRVGEHVDRGAILNVRTLCKAYTTNVITRVGFSERLWDRTDNSSDQSKFDQLGEAFETLLLHVGVPHMGDFVPWLRFVDWHSTAEINRCRKIRDEVLHAVVRSHAASLDPEKPRDVVDELLISLGNEDVDGIGVVLAELYVTASDTTAVSLEWIVGLLMDHEDVQERLADEIRSGVGSGADDFATAEQISKMPWLNAVIREGLRYRSLVPLLLPHVTTETDDLGGYHIPSGTTIFGHWGLISMHPSYGDPEAFRPERWLALGEAQRGNGPTYLPFGYGPRQCAGQILAMEEMRYALASLFAKYRFRWAPSLASNPKRMLACFALTAPSVQPFEAVVTRR